MCKQDGGVFFSFYEQSMVPVVVKCSVFSFNFSLKSVDPVMYYCKKPGFIRPEDFAHINSDWSTFLWTRSMALAMVCRELALESFYEMNMSPRVNVTFGRSLLYC
jgi:hypothetical protein